MSLNLNDWDMHNLKIYMRDKSLLEILDLYKRKEEELTSASVLYMRACNEGIETTHNELKGECERIEKERCVIALHIADIMTKVQPG